MAKFEWTYGIQSVLKLLEQSPERLLEVWIEESRKTETIGRLCAQQAIALVRCKPKTLERHLGDVVHQGVAAKTIPLPASTESDLLVRAEQLGLQACFLILDGVTDPHNLGACFRSVAAFGFHGIVVPKDHSVGLTPAVRKVACGAVDLIPFYQVTNLARCLTELKNIGVWVKGSVCDEQAKPMDQLDFTSALALVMGSEGEGLRRLTQERCDELFYIPMQGKIESLNVSVATGICCYEVMRQRKLH